METVPTQIGTCGTIQFLISQEIDFFTNFESSNKTLNNGGNGIASTSREHSSEDLNRHKRVNRKSLTNKGNSTGARILPRICSSVDVIATSARIQDIFAFMNLAGMGYTIYNCYLESVDGTEQ